jgi:FdrA protein
MDAGLKVASNAPVPGAMAMLGAEGAHSVVDLGADEYTGGRPHPMIAPEMRTPHIREALADPRVGVVLLDIVLGYGAHDDPSEEIARLGPFSLEGPLVIASVTGTEGDPQVYSRQVAALRAANVIVAGSNAEAAALAAAAIKA